MAEFSDAELRKMMGTLSLLVQDSGEKLTTCMISWRTIVTQNINL